MPTVEQLERLEAIDPQDPFLPYARALELAKQNDHAAAITAFDRCLELDPAYLYAYFHKARSLEAMGRVDEAAASLQEGLRRERGASDAKARSELAAYLGTLRA